MSARNDGRILQSAALAAGAMVGLNREQVLAIVRDHREASVVVSSDEQMPSTHRCATFVRICSALRGVLGHSQENIEHWLQTENLSLEGIPLAMMSEGTGLQTVLDYLEAQGNRE